MRAILIKEVSTEVLDFDSLNIVFKYSGKEN